MNKTKSTKRQTTNKQGKNEQEEEPRNIFLNQIQNPGKPGYYDQRPRANLYNTIKNLRENAVSLQ